MLSGLPYDQISSILHKIQYYRTLHIQRLNTTPLHMTMVVPVRQTSLNSKECAQNLLFAMFVVVRPILPIPISITQLVLRTIFIYIYIYIYVKNTIKLYWLREQHSTSTLKKHQPDMRVVHALVMPGTFFRRRSRHSRCMHNPQFHVSGKKPMGLILTSRVQVQFTQVNPGSNTKYLNYLISFNILLYEILSL